MLFDYIAEYGNIPFEDEPLNHIDLLAFSMLCNFDFPPETFGMPLPEALREARVPMVRQRRGKEFVPAHPDRNDLKLAEMMETSNRYSEVEVRGFESIYEDRVRQFAGVALGIGDILIPVFRGTDNTFTGWRATLKLSFDEARPSHGDAAEFLDRFAETADGPIIVCGHSKGGNLAMYAASSCSGTTAGRIAQVVGFDAPGLPESVRATAGYAYAAPLAVNFVPRSSVVGTVHRAHLQQIDPRPETRFIRSKGLLLQQHYPYEWLTCGDTFVFADQALVGKTLEKGLDVVIKRISDARKAKIIDSIFDLLDRSGKATFNELLK